MLFCRGGGGCGEPVGAVTCVKTVYLNICCFVGEEVGVESLWVLSLVLNCVSKYMLFCRGGGGCGEPVGAVTLPEGCQQLCEERGDAPLHR